MKTLTMNLIDTKYQKRFLSSELVESLGQNVLNFIQRTTSILLVSFTLFLMTKRPKISDFIQSKEVLPLDSGNEVLDRFYKEGIRLFVQRNDLQERLEG